jgi:hypothetical protein
MKNLILMIDHLRTYLVPRSEEFCVTHKMEIDITSIASLGSTDNLEKGPATPTTSHTPAAKQTKHIVCKFFMIC